MGKWINADLNFYGARIVCWEDDYMPFDFCFVFVKEGSKWSAVGYIDVYRDCLQYRIPYLHWVEDFNGKIMLSESTRIRGGTVAWDKGREDVKWILMRLASVLNNNMDDLIVALSFDEEHYEIISASSGRVSVQGRAIAVNKIDIYDVEEEPEKVLALTSLVEGRALLKDVNLRIIYYDYSKEFNVTHVFVADRICKITTKNNYVQIYLKGAGTEWILTFPRSWFKIRYCDFELEDWSGFIVTLRNLARRFFLKKGIYIVDNVTLKECYEQG